VTIFISRQLLFIHIPKTAGTVLRGYLEGHFLPQAVVPNQVDRDNDPDCYHHLPSFLKKIARERLQGAPLICGHLPYHRLRPLLGASSYTISMLRHPIARAISEILHHQRHNEALYGDQSFMQMITQHPECYRQQWTYFGDTLEEAIEQAKNVDFIGIQEHFEPSMSMLAHALGWELPKKSPFENVADNYPETLSHQALHRLIEALEQDTIFYAEALQRFHKQAFSFFSLPDKTKLA
jgi:hypothetical protein